MAVYAASELPSGLKDTEKQGLRPGHSPQDNTAFGNKSTPLLFTPWKARNVTFKNRVVLSPMCMYSAPTGTGMPTDFHLVHLGQYAIRGVSLIFTEAAAILPEGRLTPQDLGIWSDEHVPAYRRIVDFLHTQGARAGIQLHYSGRKASVCAPWLSDGMISPAHEATKSSLVVPKELGGWDVIGPTTEPHSPKHPTPTPASAQDLEDIKQAFVDAAIRADKAGFDVIDVMGAHGYMLAAFLTPTANTRSDQYGGSLENRMRWPLEVAQAVRDAWPADKPLFWRLGATEWHDSKPEGQAGDWQSWGPQQAAIFAEQLNKIGIDLIDVTTGGNYYKQKITVGPAYQTPFARELKQNPVTKGMLVSTVGLITDAKQVEEILQEGSADLIFVGRELLRDPNFVVTAANELDAVIAVANQYQKAHTRMYKKLDLF